MINEDSSAASAEPADHPEPKQPSILDDLQHLSHDVGKLFTGSFDLIALEGRLAAVSFIWLAALGICLAAALISVWSLIMIAFGLWLGSQGFTVPLSLLGIALVNLVLSVVLWFCIHRLSLNLTFQASRQHFFKSSQSTSRD